MFLKILFALAVIVAGFAIVAALQPAAYHVTRSTTIAAPAAAVFARVNDLHQWQEFSPWAKLDPEVKNTFAGSPAGAGAVLSWVGNSKVGEGRMTITESRPAELIRMNLEFIKPMPGTSVVEFTFQPDGTQTQVTWTMSGDNSFLGKAMCLVVSMDKMVGGDFEKGLAALKSLSEAAARK